MNNRESNKRNAFQLVFMIIVTCLSQVIALYKSRFTAVNFGASNYMDAYNFALNIATFVFAFITTGVTTVIIPAYVNKSNKKAIDSFITIIYSAVFIVIVIILLFRWPLIDMLTNRGHEFTEIVGDFLFITFITQGISAFLAVTTGYYQSIGKYITPKIILLFSNLLVAILLISGVVTNIRIYLNVLVFGALVGFIFDVTVAIKLGFRYHPRIELNNPELKKMLIVFWPTLFSSGVYKIHTMVDTTIATNLPEGQITILSYSTQIITMVNNVIVGNLTVYAYPKIIAKMKENSSKRNFWDYSIIFHAVVVLLIAEFINAGHEGIYLIFFGGKFDFDDVYLLYIGTCIYIFGQQFNIIRDLIYRYFYANGNTKETFKNSVLVSVINIMLSLILVKFWGVIGIILGTILSSLISLTMITVRFEASYGIGIKFSNVLLEYGKNLVAMIVSVAFVQILKNEFTIDNIFINIGLYAIITIAVYVITLVILKTRIKNIKL